MPQGALFGKDHPARAVRLVKREGDAAFLGFGAQQIGGKAAGCPQVLPGFVQRIFFGFDPAEGQKFLDQGRKMFGALVNILHIFGIARRLDGAKTFGLNGFGEP